MAIKKNFLDVNFKKDMDAIALGAFAMFGALCIPKVGDAISAGANKVKALVGRVL